MLVLYDQQSDITWCNGTTQTAEQLAEDSRNKGLLNAEAVLINDDEGRTFNWRYLSVLKDEYSITEPDAEKALEELKDKWGRIDPNAEQNLLKEKAEENAGAIMELASLLSDMMEASDD